MPGPNYVLDKGFEATGTTPYDYGEIVALTGTDGEMQRNTSAASVSLGVNYERVDAELLSRGTTVLTVRLLGIASALAGASITVGDKLTNDASARAVTAAAGNPVFGTALSSASGAGEYVDVLMASVATTA